MVLTIHDERAGATSATARLLTLPDARMTARELIRQRVMHEVRQYNDSRAEPFPGLLKLSDTKLAANDEESVRPRLDPEQQVNRAFESFRKSGFTLLVDGTQVGNLDQQLELSADSRITFLRLTPAEPLQTVGY